MYRDVGATELRARVVELEEALARQRQRADDASSALDRANRLLNRKQALVQELWTKSNHFEKKARPKPACMPNRLFLIADKSSSALGISIRGPSCTTPKSALW